MDAFIKDELYDFFIEKWSSQQIGDRVRRLIHKGILYQNTDQSYRWVLPSFVNWALNQWKYRLRCDQNQ